MFGAHATTPLEPVQDASIRPWLQAPVIDLAGARVGSLREILIDPESALRWLWVNVAPRPGLRFGLVPAAGAVYGNGRVFVAHTRETIRCVAQSGDASGYTDGGLRSESYRHYGLIGLPRRRGRLLGAARNDPYA